MELANSLFGFFYNIIPGFVFLLFNSFYFESIEKIVYKPADGAIGVLQFIVISVFLGFVFQSLTKILRDNCLDQNCISRIEKEDEQILLKGKSYLKSIYDRQEEDTIKTIYLMHNFLVAKYGVKILPEFFSSRLALWSNLFIASVITIFFIPLSSSIYTHTRTFSGNMLLDILLLTLFSWHSLNISKKYLFALFDSTIRTFVSIHSLNRKSIK